MAASTKGKSVRLQCNTFNLVGPSAPNDFPAGDKAFWTLIPFAEPIGLSTVTS